MTKISIITQNFVQYCQSMQAEYMTIQYDRSHLQTSLPFLPSLAHPLDLLDLISLLLFLLYVGLTLFRYASRLRHAPAPTEVVLDRADKGNAFPFFSPIRTSKKGAKARDGKDRDQVQLVCEKCKYVTEISEKNLAAQGQ